MECGLGVFDGTQSDVCQEICGDGVDLMFYPCDDGDLDPGDGCDENCNIEPGWDCAGGT